MLLSTEGLVYGDQVEAFYKGTLVHPGHVTDIAPNEELFWIMDYLTGDRRLLDVVEFQIVRAGVREGAVGALASTAAAPQSL